MLRSLMYTRACARSNKEIIRINTYNQIYTCIYKKHSQLAYGSAYEVMRVLTSIKYIVWNHTQVWNVTHR